MEKIISDLISIVDKSSYPALRREGLLETPNRVAKFYKEFITHGEPNFALTTFDSEGMDEMIVQVNIPFYSLCEHHMLPFFGAACVGYLPNNKIIGLSKLARIVDFYARRLQNQERLSKQIADCLDSALKPNGVGVIIRARHMCMEMRGIKARDANTTTSYLTGSIKDVPAARAEFLSFANELHEN